jgi:hypothetical protein
MLLGCWFATLQFCGKLSRVRTCDFPVGEQQHVNAESKRYRSNQRLCIAPNTSPHASIAAEYVIENTLIPQRRCWD